MIIQVAVLCAVTFVSLLLIGGYLLCGKCFKFFKKDNTN